MVEFGSQKTIGSASFVTRVKLKVVGQPCSLNFGIRPGKDVPRTYRSLDRRVSALQRRCLACYLINVIQVKS